MSKQDELIQAFAEKWTIVHKSTCNLSQNWFEAEQALADTPEKFRDESWQMAYEEMREKKNTCTCGVKKLLISDLRTLLSHLVPGEEEIKEKKNDLYSLYEHPNDDEQMNHNDNMERYRRGFDEAYSFIINLLTGKE